MKRHAIRRVFQILTGVLLGLAAVLWFQGSRGDGRPADTDTHFLASPLPAPEIRLLSHRGDTVDLGDLPNELTAVFFGYTSCPDVCPLTLSHLSRAMILLGPLAEQVQVLFITVDPQRDSPERMEAYLAPFNPSFIGLTGQEARIRKVATDFGVFFERVGSGPDYTVDHSARTFIIDAEGTIPLTFPLDATPERMADDIAHLLRSRSVGSSAAERNPS